MSNEGEKRIIDEIVNDAKRRAEALKKEAFEEARELLVVHASRVKLEQEVILGRGEQEARLQQAKILADARIRTKRKRMAAQEEYMRMAFQRAESSLQRFAKEGEGFGPTYLDVLRGLIKDSALSIGQDSLEVLVKEGDRERVSRLLDSLAMEVSNTLKKRVSLILSAQTVQSIGGVIVRTQDGALAVDNTFESRLRRMKESLRTEASKILFEE